MSFDLDFGNDDVIQHLSISNDEHPQIRYGYLNMVFVRLSRFKKSLDECETLQDKLMYSLCHAHKLRGMPEQFREDVLGKIFFFAKIANFSMDERAAYEADMMNKRDQYAIRMTAINEGIAIGEARGETRGRQEGIAIGEAKGLLQAARQMKAEKMSSDLISRITGLPKEDVERL